MYTATVFEKRAKQTPLKTLVEKLNKLKSLCKIVSKW
jgi:hypothetical protein